METLQTYIAIASMAFKNNLPGLLGEEKILTITDQGSDQNQNDLVEIARQAFRALGHQTIDFLQVDQDVSEEKAKEILTNYSIIFNVSVATHRGLLF